MLLQVILEGLGLGVLLVLICAAGIRKGAVGMVHLYSPAVQQRCVKLGLTTRKKIKRNALIFKAVCIPGYIGYVLVCVYGINGAKGFVQGFWQLLVILSVMNLMDRLLVDGYWVGHTNAWTIPGTEDLKPYITAKDKQKKWIHFVMLLAGKTRYSRWMLAFHPVTWNLLLVTVPDIAQAMQVPVATWMSVMSQSSTNSAIMVWCIAAAVYERSHTQ